MDEPGWTGLVAFRNGRRELSAPARTAGLTRSVTLTPEERFDRRVAPSAIVIRTAGIVMVSSVPPMPAGGLSETLSATSMAIAPAFWQFLALTTKVHVPRSTSAMFPPTAAALVKGEQASVVAAPAASEGSAAATTWPVTPAAVSWLPNEAVPTESSPAMPPGEFTVISGVPGERVWGTAANTCAPFQTT